MTRNLLIVLSLCMLTALSGCRVRGEPPTPDQARALEITREVWQEQGLAWTSTCANEIVVILVADDATMRYEVKYCAAESPVCVETREAHAGDLDAIWMARAQAGCLFGICTAGSVGWDQSEVWPVGLWAPRRVVILISGYLAPEIQLETIVHEYAHALSMCAFGVGVGPDYVHSNANIWGRDGVVYTAIGRLSEESTP